MDASNIEVKQPFPCPDVAYLRITPNLGDNLRFTANIFKALGEKSKALVLFGYGTGTTPTSLNPFISELTQRGIPVFVLSSNEGENYGVQKITYGVQQDAVDAGIIPLKDPNVNNAEGVIIDIQKAINDGKTGAELVHAVVEKYGTPVKDIPQD